MIFDLEDILSVVSGRLVTSNVKVAPLVNYVCPIRDFSRATIANCIERTRDFIKQANPALAAACDNLPDDLSLLEDVGFRDRLIDQFGLSRKYSLSCAEDGSLIIFASEPGNQNGQGVQVIPDGEEI